MIILHLLDTPRHLLTLAVLFFGSFIKRLIHFSLSDPLLVFSFPSAMFVLGSVILLLSIFKRMLVSLLIFPLNLAEAGGGWVYFVLL